MSNGFMIFLNVWGVILILPLYIESIKTPISKGRFFATTLMVLTYSGFTAFCILNIIELIG